MKHLPLPERPAGQRIEAHGVPATQHRLEMGHRLAHQPIGVLRREAWGRHDGRRRDHDILDGGAIKEIPQEGPRLVCEAHLAHAAVLDRSAPAQALGELRCGLDHGGTIVVEKGVAECRLHLCDAERALEHLLCGGVGGDLRASGHHHIAQQPLAAQQPHQLVGCNSLAAILLERLAHSSQDRLVGHDPAQLAIPTSLEAEGASCVHWRQRVDALR